MGISAQFSTKALDELLKEVPEILAGEIIRALSYLGEQSIKRIRDRSAKESWIDQTGNLRSSIGYAIYDHGRILMESAFEQVKEGMEGRAAGKRTIDELATRYSQTYALVVVAGMKYAEYVEAMETKDVLASTELWAKSKVDEYLHKALERASDKILLKQRQLGL